MEINLEMSIKVHADSFTVELYHPEIGDFTARTYTNNDRAALFAWLGDEVYSWVSLKRDELEEG